MTSLHHLPEKNEKENYLLKNEKLEYIYEGVHALKKNAIHLMRKLQIIDRYIEIVLFRCHFDVYAEVAECREIIINLEKRLNEFDYDLVNGREFEMKNIADQMQEVEKRVEFLEYEILSTNFN